MQTAFLGSGFPPETAVMPAQQGLGILLYGKKNFGRKGLSQTLLGSITSLGNTTKNPERFTTDKL